MLKSNTDKERTDKFTKDWFSPICLTAQIIFLIFKLCDIISWSWFFVLIPAIVWAAYLLILFLVLVLGSVVVFTIGAVVMDEDEFDDRT